jgi:hypothetical protein
VLGIELIAEDQPEGHTAFQWLRRLPAPHSIIACWIAKWCVASFFSL